MSLYSTSSPSIEQTRLYLTRPPSVAWTWWNRMSLSSVAEYSFTPMLTRPNDTAPRQIERMSAPHPFVRPGAGRHGTTRNRVKITGWVRAGTRARSADPPRPPDELIHAFGLRRGAAVLD